MITTVLTTTVLVTALTGSSPQAPAARLCSQVADAWRPLLSGAELPDGFQTWLREVVRFALTTACEPGRTGPESPTSATRVGTGDDTSVPGAPGTADAAESSRSGALDIDGPSDPARGASTDINGLFGPSADPFPDAIEPSGSAGGTSSPGITASSGPSGPASPDVAGSSGSPSSSRGHRPAVSSEKPAEFGATRPPSTSSRSRRLSPGQTAVAAALRHIGRPYVWGGGSGEGPTGGGFDCSGLALYAWSKAGTALSHYTGSQFRQGRRVPFSQLRPGDLVFFGGGTGDPTHVGVYVKDGVMVHAPKPGDVVRTTNFADSPYYRARYRGAIRPGSRTSA
ncbi:cell wall-associated NlpC family hydrolase [Streptosporangium album]|uniref:Cell wall-associated NlpC family hydrolase n=1 Tax=Streptosporangium album TaxID=47479 RepID=A0A7W7RXM6_9ACTN|nr:C40 family peptidase [Streptosporangium album]MBB4940114.1 cell wall-associated NlpC family hydrolase [Streptosporangium album]